jgi:hypothetical protein
MISEQEATVRTHTVTVTEQRPAEQQPADVVQKTAEIINPDLESLLAALEYERISGLAYFYWQQRGCPVGSPDEDWFRAERDIRQGK